MSQSEVSVVIPAFNEEGRIAKVLEEYVRLAEVLVVANGCTDATPEIARRLGAKTVAIFVPDEDGRRLVPIGLVGYEPEFIEQRFGPIHVDGPGASAKVFRTKEAAMIRDVESDRDVSEPSRAFNLSLGLRSA
mgnify:CR=1 FL=1